MSQVSKHVLEPEGKVVIGIVGKYTGLADAYKSLNEALSHGGIFNNVKVELKWFESEELNSSNTSSLLANCHGILVPGGFGTGSKEKLQQLSMREKTKYLILEYVLECN